MIKTKEKTSDKKKHSQTHITCHFPWTSIYVSPEGNIKHCCNTNITSLGNLSKLSFDEIWNGQLYQTIRHKISLGDFEGAFCNPICPGLRNGKGYPWPYENPQSAETKLNYTKATENFFNHQKIVSHFPLYLKLEFSNRCNLRCIMCFYEFTPPYQFISEHAIQKLLSFSNKALTVTLMGGEVFFNKQDLLFIDSFNPGKDTTVCVITNGTLLNEAMIKRLSKFHKLYLDISVDGTSTEIYNKIRKKGNWEVVNENIKRVVSVAKNRNGEGYEWNISLSFTVMASNFIDIPHALQYAIDLNILISFNPVRGFHLFDENIFIYKQPFQQNNNWKEVLESAHIILENNKTTYPYYLKAKEYLNDIEKNLLKDKIKTPHPLLIKTINNLVKTFTKKNNNAGGLSSYTRRTGHIIEVYYNCKTGKYSTIKTIKYFLFKISKRIFNKQSYL